MILVRQRREAHAGLLEVERALLRFGAGEGWGADRLRAARLARRRPFPAAVLHRLGRAETGGKRERGAGGEDRKSDVSGKSVAVRVDTGGGRCINKKLNK